MQRRRLGRTNLVVGEIGVGCWAIGGLTVNLGTSCGWGGVTDNDSIDGLLTAIKMKANLFDTADVYGLGKSERLLGSALRKAQENGLIKRENVIISSKVGYFRGCAPHGFDPLNMRHQLEMSLQNLDTEYIDIYFFHHLDFGSDDKYLRGAISQMQNFRDQGHIRYFGLRGPHKFSLDRQSKEIGSNSSYERFGKLAELINPDVISLRYNMISPTYDNPETDLFKWAEERDVGILIYKPLGQGLLLNKYDPRKPPKFGIGDNRLGKAWFRQRGLRILKDRLSKIGQKFECEDTRDFVKLAIKYCLSRSRTACVLVGFRNADQISQSMSTDGNLTQEECKHIKEVFEGINDEIGPFIDSHGVAYTI